MTTMCVWHALVMIVDWDGNCASQICNKGLVEVNGEVSFTQSILGRGVPLCGPCLEGNERYAVLVKMLS